MGDEAFVSPTDIATTPERLWSALTEPVFTRRYWGISFVTDWKVGSTMTVQLEKSGVSIADPSQVILESDPPRRLSSTWHTFPPEWATTYGFSDEYLEQVASEARSKVTFAIEPVGALVRLRVVHDGFEKESAVRRSITAGWPPMLSGLKQILEEDDARPQ